MQLNHF